MLNIQRNLSVNEEMYVYLLEKKANTIIAKAAIVPEVSVIEVARNVGVVGPDKARIVYYFLAVGLLLALLVSFIRTAFFDRIQNLRELKQLSTIPVIGGIPRWESSSERRLLVQSNPRSNLAEAYRSVRTNLQYFSKGNGNRLLLFTSLHPGEGKTFSSVNTACILAGGHKKVLLLDCDMHKPKVHTAFDLPNLSGLSSYIINRHSLDEVIQPSGIENLDVITAGPVPPNASELVLSPRLAELLHNLKESYDMVVVDTPPLMLITDALVLMQLMDVGIFVLSTERATRSGVKHLDEMLSTHNLTNGALLLNGIRPRKWKYYYSKYGYMYGYGYGYGSPSGSKSEA